MAEDNLIANLGTWITTANGALGLFRGVRDELKKSGAADTAKVDQKIDEAEQVLTASGAQLAQALGYHLCRCTYPPQVMLLTGRHPKRGDEIYKCGKCGNQEPSQHYFDELDRQDATIRQINAERGSWLS